MRIDNQGTGNGYNTTKVERIKPSGTVETLTSLKDYQHAPEEKPLTANSSENLESAAEYIDKALKMANNHLEFKFHEESGRYHIKIVDNTSSEVIREIPPENVLDISAMIKKKLDEMLGFLVDKLV